MGTLGEFLSPEAGQRRRQWLTNQEEKASEALKYYLGPAAKPVDAMAKIFAALSDPADVVDYVSASKRLPQSQNWQEAVSNTGQLATAGAAMLMPGVSARMAEGAVDFAGDAARFMRDQSGAVGIDPISQRGDDILQRLRTDPASVTDEMLDMGDTTQNARLNEYLFNNYDLPMDEASRMARAEGMGFDTDTYHGTMQDFPAHDAAMRGQNFDGKHASTEATFTSQMPEMAARYAEGGAGYGIYNEGGNIQPLMVPAADRYSDAMGFLGPQKFIDDAMAAKADGVSVIDFGPKLEAEMTGLPWETAVFDPSNIRSRFARFDPRLAHLRNLSAGLAGGAALPLGAYLNTQPDLER